MVSNVFAREISKSLLGIKKEKEVLKLMSSVILRCPKCGRQFRVLEDERFDHYCPHCNYGQPAGIDYYGNEIVAGDEIVITPDGEMVLKEDLDKFLSEVYDFEFTEAE